MAKSTSSKAVFPGTVFSLPLISGQGTKHLRDRCSGQRPGARICGTKVPQDPPQIRLTSSCARPWRLNRPNFGQIDSPAGRCPAPLLERYYGSLVLPTPRLFRDSFCMTCIWLGQIPFPFCFMPEYEEANKSVESVTRRLMLEPTFLHHPLDYGSARQSVF